ncbi:hypothetical protein GQ53DRAFT_536695 [Thozetella sp. PMI_491]|nr:hypothetical protein GQ53DRAFT_536695 [Thozetella sp. PMI_491]
MVAKAAAQVANSNQNFHYFPLLPYELRAQIWRELLRDATPLVYKMMIQYNRRSLVRGSRLGLPIYHYNAQPDDVVILDPGIEGRYDQDEAEPHRRQLAACTFASRAALATCSESRQLAVGLLPDSLPFRMLPHCWTEEGDWLDEPADGSGCPEYVLRFNGARDIVLFHADWEDQEAVVKISELRGPPIPFTRMQHIGLTVRSLERGHADRDNYWDLCYGVNPAECMCSTPACSDACRLEPLPRFLACFPSLKTFYLARVSSDTVDAGDQSMYDWTREEDATCHCEPEPRSGEPKHKWPIIRVSDIDRWCVAWDERTDCFPIHYLVEEIRQGWRSHFPYYKALDHLDIKFLRRLDPIVS